MPEPALQPLEQASAAYLRLLRLEIGASTRTRIGPTPPASPDPGDKWLNETDGVEYTFAWGAWINPQAPLSVNWDNIENVPSTFAPSAHTHSYSSLTGIPSTFAPSAHTHSYSSLTGIPSTFAPSAHTHPFSDSFYTSLVLTSLQNADRFYFGDVSNGNATAVTTFEALKLALKAYFDTLYAPVSGLPPGAYEIPGGGAGYYYNSGDYYTQP